MPLENKMKSNEKLCINCRFYWFGLQCKSEASTEWLPSETVVAKWQAMRIEQGKKFVN